MASRRSHGNRMRRSIGRSCRRITRGGGAGLWQSKANCQGIFDTAIVGTQKPWGYSRCKLLHKADWSRTRGARHERNGKWDNQSVYDYAASRKRSKARKAALSAPVVPTWLGSANDDVTLERLTQTMRKPSKVLRTRLERLSKRPETYYRFSIPEGAEHHEGGGKGKGRSRPLPRRSRRQSWGPRR